MSRALGGWSIGRDQIRHGNDLLQKIFIAHKLHFGIEFLLADVGPRQFHQAGRLRRNYRIEAAAPKQYLEMGFITRRKKHDHHCAH